MASANRNLGKSGLQGFFIMHVEKLALAIVASMAIYFLYAGYSLEGYKADRSPLKLKDDASSTLTLVMADHWPKLQEDPLRVAATNHLDLVKENGKPTDGTLYSFGHFDPPKIPNKKKRKDPEIFAPMKVEVSGHTVAVYEQTTSDDPYEDDAVVAVKKAKAPAAPPKPGAKAKKGMDVIDEMGMDMGGAGAKKGGKGAGNKKGPPGMMPPGMMMPGMGEMLGEESGMGDMMGGMGMGGAVAGASVSADFVKNFIPGYRPGGQGGGMPRGEGDVAITRGVTRHFMAIKAIVPFQKQVDEFDQTFVDAEDWNPTRDYPNYNFYSIQRAEVSVDPKAALVWADIKVRSMVEEYEAKWGGDVLEIADERFLNESLTNYIPPALLVATEKLGLHSEVPKAVKENAKGPGIMEEDSKDPVKDPNGAGEPDEPDDGSAGKRPPRKNRGMPGAMGGGMMPPGMDGGGMGMMPPGMDGGGMGMMPPGMGGGMGMGGGGMGGAMVNPQSIIAKRPKTGKYRLIRFFDFSVEPGKDYQYRVRVWIDDPNRPKDPTFEPKKQILENAVAVRIAELEAKEKKRTFWRTSEWSEPSAVVRLPDATRYVAGGVQLGAIRYFSDPVLPGKKMGIAMEEPSATLLSVIWDDKRAVEVPGNTDAQPDATRKEVKKSAYLGTLLNFRKDTNVLKPDNLEIRTVKGYEFKTNAMVLDMQVSEPFPKKKADEKKTPLAPPSEILLIDGQGRLVVRNEIEDIEEFRRLTIQDEPASKPGAAGGMVPPGM